MMYYYSILRGSSWDVLGQKINFKIELKFRQDINDR